MIDWVLAVLSLYGVYRNEIFRRSEDENDITDWWI
jgi:hypothetical protein